MSDWINMEGWLQDAPDTDLSLADTGDDLVELLKYQDTEDPGQLPEHEWYNTIGTDADPIPMFTDIDATDDEFDAQTMDLDDPEDAAEIALFEAWDLGNLEHDEPPFEEQWWLHDSSTVPEYTGPVDPPQPGDIDPDTGEVVPGTGDTGEIEWLPLDPDNEIVVPLDVVDPVDYDIELEDGWLV